MARLEHPREDLLREATALVERIELAVAGATESVVIGFRQEGAGSIYFGADPVLQFNQHGDLRRAFCDGRLLKAESGRMIGLLRRREPGVVTLEREDLSDAEQRELLDGITQRIAGLSRQLDAGEYRVTGQVPADRDVLGRVRAWLRGLPAPPRVAQTPNANCEGRPLRR